MISDPAQLNGKVAAADIAADTYIQQGMVIDAPVLRPGQREVAILINAETGVAGKVRAGMFVDIYGTFQEQQQNQQKNCAVRVISRAQVISVGQLRTQRGDAPNEVDQVVPITFALSAADSLKLTHAESFASKVRLALIGAGGEPTTPKLEPVCQATPSR